MTYQTLITQNPTLLATPQKNLLDIADEVFGYCRHIEPQFFNTCADLAAKQQYKELAIHINTIKEEFEPQSAEESLLAIYTHYTHATSIQYELTPISVNQLLLNIQNKIDGVYLIIITGEPIILHTFDGFHTLIHNKNLIGCHAAWELVSKTPQSS